MSKIAIIASIYNEVDKIKKQLKQKKVKNIDVFEYGSKPEGYDIIIDNVRPNKEYGEILDLGQCLRNHGFPEEKYTPPKKTDIQKVDKEALERAMESLRMEHLVAVIESDEPEIITKEKYNNKIDQIKNKRVKLTDMTTRELSNRLEVTENVVEIIAITATLLDKLYCTNDLYDNYGRPARGYISNKKKEVVNFLNPGSIGWIADNWIQLLKDEEPYYQNKYIKSLRTRCKNLILEKGSIWSIRFFIEYLLEQDKLEKEMTIATSNGEEIQIEYEGFNGVALDINEDEIPF